MKSILILLFFCSSINLIAQDSISSKLNGSWILSAIRMDNVLLNSDSPDPGPYRWVTPNTHWLFKDRKVYEIDYPCCLFQMNKFKVNKEGDLCRMYEEKGRTDELYSVQFRNDSLILDEKLSYSGARYYFIPDTIPLKELEIFTNGYLNPVCLYGDWEIPAGEVSVKDDAINVWYPWKMKEEIHVDANNLNEYWSDNRFYLEVDGVKRPFKVENVSMYDEDLILIPENWVNDYIKKQKLDSYQISNVWLRRKDY